MNEDSFARSFHMSTNCNPLSSRRCAHVRVISVLVEPLAIHPGANESAPRRRQDVLRQSHLHMMLADEIPHYLHGPFHRCPEILRLSHYLFKKRLIFLSFIGSSTVSEGVHLATRHIDNLLPIATHLKGAISMLFGLAAYLLGHNQSLLESSPAHP